ncbi:hypothetical protein ES319_A05G265000v1 [Gossypium barbadense]|uniref:Uncharacterized protein n=2 Tax=Gossypium TaxID=3633 RepID=A0A5J5VUC9_GOSBA|nr:hypothetical protein ES319_A05G265000v1 [Gossypium barbadense]TYH18469.1 hypothetical protein ES288_A05G273700v1 [Gossypium darwinii]
MQKAAMNASFCNQRDEERWKGSGGKNPNRSSQKGISDLIEMKKEGLQLIDHATLRYGPIGSRCIDGHSPTKRDGPELLMTQLLAILFSVMPAV